MRSITEPEQLFEVLQGPEKEWPAAVPDIDIQAALSNWAATLIEQLPRTVLHYWPQRWQHRSDYGPLPIGRRSIADHPGLRDATHINDRAVLQRFALLPGDEHLYLPIGGTIDSTQLELLFLVRQEWLDPFYAYRHNVPYEFQWVVADVACRITGYPHHKPVLGLVTNARKWWRETIGRQPLPNVGGRPRKELPYEFAVKAWHGMKELPVYEDKDPTDREFLDHPDGIYGRQMSQDTFTARKKEWEAVGNPWPPKHVP